MTVHCDEDLLSDRILNLVGYTPEDVVKKIEIVFEPNKHVVIKVERYVGETLRDRLDSVITVIEEFGLVKQPLKVGAGETAV